MAVNSTTDYVKGMLTEGAPPGDQAPGTIKPNRNAKVMSLDLLVDAEWNARQEYPEATIRQLAASLNERSIGMIHPPTVRPYGGKYQIVCGHRRVRAAREAGWTEIPVIINERLSDEQAELLGFLENVQREDLSPSSLKVALERLERKFADDQEGGRRAMARYLKKDESWVTQNLRSLNDDVAGELLMDGAITLKQATEISRVRIKDVDGELDPAATLRAKHRLAELATAPGSDAVGGGMLRLARKYLEGDTTEDVVLLAMSHTERGKELSRALKPGPHFDPPPARIEPDRETAHFLEGLDNLVAQFGILVDQMEDDLPNADPELRYEAAKQARRLLGLAS